MRSEEVETGRYEFPQEKRKLLKPSRRPIRVDVSSSFGVNFVNGFLLVQLKK